MKLNVYAKLFFIGYFLRKQKKPILVVQQNEITWDRAKAGTYKKSDNQRSKNTPFKNITTLKLVEEHAYKTITAIKYGPSKPKK